MKNPYVVIHSRYVTEKTKMLENLQEAKSNPSIARCQSPKYTFLVDHHANKKEIAHAIETIFSDQNVTVKKVNTLHTKRKEKKRGRGKKGFTSSYKKAIVTMESGDQID